MRYPLHLPVLIRMARQEMQGRSENISLGGILLSSNFLIPEGSMVDVAVGVQHTADPGILLSARGTVLRAQPKVTGDFTVAIQLERSFQLPRTGREPRAVVAADGPRSTEPKKNRKENRKESRAVFYRAPYIAAWHTET